MTIQRTQRGDQAHGTVQIAIKRLATKYPFHAKTLEKFEIRISGDIDTVAVTIAEDMVHLLYNPEFVQAISLDELGGTLLHEVHHIVFGHLLADPAEYPDRWARTIAEEVTVNEFVTEPLPGNPIRLELFPSLPPMESTDQRYHRLKRIKKRTPLGSLSASAIGRPTSAGQGRQTRDPEGGGQEPKKDEKSSHATPVGTVIDDHSVWHEAWQDIDRSEAASQAAVHDAIAEAGVGEVPACLRNAVRNMGIGCLPGDGEHNTTDAAHGRLNWSRLLRRYVGRELSLQPDFARPSRRHPSLIGIIPGRRRRGARPKIMAVIDTSGSVTPELLDAINGELRRLAAEYVVTVVECDAQIQRVYPYRPIRSVRGRGGTDLRPPLEPAFLRRHSPDLVIYFTDGYGPAPERPPSCRVVWCITPSGQRPEAWGGAIEMDALADE